MSRDKDVFAGCYNLWQVVTVQWAGSPPKPSAAIVANMQGIGLLYNQWLSFYLSLQKFWGKRVRETQLSDRAQRCNRYRPMVFGILSDLIIPGSKRCTCGEKEGCKDYNIQRSCHVTRLERGDIVVIYGQLQSDAIRFTPFPLSSRAEEEGWPAYPMPKLYWISLPDYAVIQGTGR